VLRSPTTLGRACKFKVLGSHKKWVSALALFGEIVFELPQPTGKSAYVMIASMEFLSSLGFPNESIHKFERLFYPIKTFHDAGSTF
jgi:hypothetical protein